MLVNVHVKNMALIQEADVDFGRGLNILTGETGAGKSIIIGAVNVALGMRGFKGFAREDADTALVELVFSVEKEEQVQKIKAFDIPVEDGLVILSRRMAGTRSISKVNGETVPVGTIRQIAEILIDIHGQHEHQSLLHASKHLEILDEYAKEELMPLKLKAASLYQDYLRLGRELEENRIDAGQKQKEMDFLNFEIQEIESAALKQGEDAELESRYRKLSNGKKIMEAASLSYEMTGYENGAAGDGIGRALRSLGSVTMYDSALEELSGQLENLENLLNDFNRDLKDYMGELSFNADDFEEIEQRLDLINRLKAKYGDSIEAILTYKAEKEERLNKLVDYEHYFAGLEKKYALAKERLLKCADAMSKVRKKHAKILEKAILEALIDLNFLDVRFEISFDRSSGVTDNGYDEVNFLISTNPGLPVRPLKDVASGGELSRIMLAIKSVLADKDETETLIFDEIDVGISGRTAQKVSEKMAVIARKHQIICITHLAQIASMADNHYVIEKKVEGNATATSIRALSENESIDELARILGGARITDIVMQSAREMKELAVSTKKY